MLAGCGVRGRLPPELAAAVFLDFLVFAGAGGAGGAGASSIRAIKPSP